MCVRPSSLEPNARRLGLRCLLDVPPSFCLVTRSLGLRTRLCELHLPLTSPLTETAVQACRKVRSFRRLLITPANKLQGFEFANFEGLAFSRKADAIVTDFGCVYEIGPVCRAEHSNTHRPLTELIGRC